MLHLGQSSPRCYTPESIVLPEPWEVAKSSCPQEVPVQLETQPMGMHFQSFRFISTSHSFLQQHQHMGLLSLLFLFPGAAPAVLQELPSSLKYLVTSPLLCAQLCSVPRAGEVCLAGWHTKTRWWNVLWGQGTGPPPTPVHCTATGFLEVAGGEGCPLLPESLGDNLARAAAEWRYSWLVFRFLFSLSSAGCCFWIQFHYWCE